MTTLIEQIQASLIRNVMGFIEVLLSSKNLALQALTAPMKSEDGTWCILDLLLAHACRDTVIDWAVEQACEWFKSEILQVSRAESGLHFNASQAHAANILDFDLEEIVQKLEVLAPCTWGVVQAVLNANPVMHWRKVVTKASAYKNRMILKSHLVMCPMQKGMGKVKRELTTWQRMK
jgi:hypothetical protein